MPIFGVHARYVHRYGSDNHSVGLQSFRYLICTLSVGMALSSAPEELEGCQFDVILCVPPIEKNQVD